MDDDILIIDDDTEQQLEHKDGWKVLVVDDEPEVHRITKITLAQFQFDNKPIEFLHAYSGEEAQAIMASEPDVALILLDVVMETDSSGLDVVRYVRDTLENRRVRIVLRTGQPGQAPEDDVVANYDINDYKDKTELTSQKLRTLIRASLRSYRDICALDRNRKGLEKVIEASKGIFEKQALRTFVEGALQQLNALLALEETSLYSLKRTAYEIRDSEALAPIISDLDGELENCPSSIIQQALKLRKNVYHDNELVIYCKNLRHCILFHIEGTRPLSEVDTYLLNLFTENIIIALENIRLNELLADNQREIIYRIGEIVETRSRESGLHVKRVALYCELFGRLLGLSEEQSEMLKRASPLHDIGKIGIPDAILHKPGKLEPDEWSVMKQHAQIGYDMLRGSDIPMFQVGALIALNHHEKWDGSGYPRGLKGEDIPLEGRITALVDVFDALGSDRCYKKAWPLEKILQLIEAENGRHFDPSLVALMLANLDEFLAIRDQYKDEFQGDS
ncbi:HD domain-containing phosphohydrolase [Pseudaeromonas sp. ZJS20]|uniref:HD domain-containing phosphohydrolase n=1 Tax=Pseudaeromonas aegiceratis TaxID=3153928 RepID=UPI00390C8460